MREFILVISMWGFNGMEWEYIGNQYVNQNMMTKSQCEALIADGQWESFRTNEFYDIQFDCFKQSQIENRNED